MVTLLPAMCWANPPGDQLPSVIESPKSMIAPCTVAAICVYLCRIFTSSGMSNPWMCWTSGHSKRTGRLEGRLRKYIHRVISLLYVLHTCGRSGEKNKGEASKVRGITRVTQASRGDRLMKRYVFCIGT